MRSLAIHETQRANFPLVDLAELLRTTVNGGASVGFVHPFSLDDSIAYWQENALPSIIAGTRLQWTASVDGNLAGTIQLVIKMPPNQEHRGEVSKLMVHPDFRNQGIATRLLETVERKAQSLGKRLLTLDTQTGSSAERLYTSFGFETVGSLPGFCKAVHEDRYDATTYMYKTI